GAQKGRRLAGPEDSQARGNPGGARHLAARIAGSDRRQNLFARDLDDIRRNVLELQLECEACVSLGDGRALLRPGIAGPRRLQRRTIHCRPPRTAWSSEAASRTASTAVSGPSETG